MGVERKIETAAEWNRQAVVEPIASARSSPDARIEDVILILMSRLRPHLPQMVRAGMYGQLTINLTFQDGTPQRATVGVEESIKIAAK